MSQVPKKYTCPKEDDFKMETNKKRKSRIFMKSLNITEARKREYKDISEKKELISPNPFDANKILSPDQYLNDKTASNNLSKASEDFNLSEAEKGLEDLISSLNGTPNFKTPKYFKTPSPFVQINETKSKASLMSSLKTKARVQNYSEKFEASKSQNRMSVPEGSMENDPNALNSFVDSQNMEDEFVSKRSKID